MKYSITEMSPKVFLFMNNNRYDRTMFFLRAQEFYESSNPNFQGKKFSFFQYMDWYAKNLSDIKSFTYASDWTGFNIPSSVIAECYDVNDERTPYDNALLSLVEELYTITHNSPFYLIGANIGAPNVVKHEVAHGLFYTNSQYREEMTVLVDKLDNRDILKNIIMTKGYAESVWKDEAQAWLATGLDPAMSDFKNQRQSFIDVFSKYPVVEKHLFDRKISLFK